MSRLRGLRGYLCGAMDRVPDGGVEWRVKLQKELVDLEVVWLDPTCKPIDIGIEDADSRKYRAQCKNIGDYDSVAAEIRAIRNVDLTMVTLSNFMVVNIDVDVHQCGSYEELFLANSQKKPIIVMVVQGKVNCPDWLIGTIPHEMIFNSWSEVHQYLRSDLDWLFFNYDLCRRFQ